MEISFRFDESGRAVTINVPVGGGFTIKVNPVGGITPHSSGDGGGSNVYGAHVHPQSVLAQIPKVSDACLKIANPKVFFDMTVDGKAAGRIIMELFADTTPRTAENFRALCTGEKGIGKSGKPLHYKGSRIHHVCRNYMFHGGDITGGNGTGSDSIYGGFFEDENFIKQHNAPGIISMANRGPDTNSSEFMICLQECPGLDGGHVVFGQVVEGLDVIKSIIDEVDLGNRIPSKPVLIANCGQIS